MKSSIHHFIEQSIIPGTTRHGRSKKHVLLLFDASGCVTQSDLTVLRLMVPTIVSRTQVDVSLVCVNHQEKFITPYIPSHALAMEEAFLASGLPKTIDMHKVLADCLSDEPGHYDGIVVMTEGRFAPFCYQALCDEVMEKSGRQDITLPPIGFFLFLPGAIPANPAYAVTRHITLAPPPPLANIPDVTSVIIQRRDDAWQFRASMRKYSSS